jgi:threonine dehydrogenase-like Zn-dependent dehydrogenase
VGDRVIVNPMLACRQRGQEPCGACRRGEYGLCRRQADGVGAITGFSPLTGGGWSGGLVAHESQLHPQGDLPDEVAVLADPFASALKPVLLEPPAPDDTVLVIGAGTIGLLAVRALRATGWEGPLAVAARYGFQAERARAAGADTVLATRAAVYEWAASLPGASSYDPTLAGKFVEGGPSLIHDTVGTERSVNDGLALAREGGRIVMTGAATRLKADWTRLWYRQIRITGAYAYGPVHWRGETRDVFALSLDLMRAGALEGMGLVTHVFELEEYRDALAVALGKDGHNSIKVAFRPGG